MINSYLYRYNNSNDFLYDYKNKYKEPWISTINLDNNIKVIYNKVIFYANNIEYEMEENMTWREYINSIYNINNFFHIEIDNSNHYGGAEFIVSNDGGVSDNSNNYIIPDKKIIRNHHYILTPSHSGGTND